MIEVKYVERYKKRKLEISGHAAAGPEGHDLVCAGVSALAITLKTALDVNGFKCKSEARDGYMSIRCRDENAVSVFHTVMCGLEALRAMYPEHIRIELTGA